MADSSKIPSRLPKPGSIPRPKAVQDLRAKRALRRSISAPDLRDDAQPVVPGQRPGTQRNLVARKPAPPPSRMVQSTTLGASRKRPAATLNGPSAVAPAKRPLVQVQTQAPKDIAKKPTVGSSGAKPKVARWDTKGQLEIANKKIESLKAENENLKHAQEELETLNAEMEKLNEEHRLLSEEFKKAEKEIEKNQGLASKVDALTREINVLETQRNELNERNTQLSLDMQKAEAKIIESELKIANLSNELAKETLCKTELMKELDEKNERVDELTSGLTKAKTEVTNAESKIAHLSASLSTHINELKEVKMEKNLFLEEVHKLQQIRRVMHNQILELKGNIRVFCRVRPALPAEGSKPVASFLFPDEASIDVRSSQDLGPQPNSYQKSKGDKCSFSYDKVFSPDCGQEEIYEELKLLVQSALDGYNVCVFAYGQTGSGKTYTMEGGSEPHEQGMIPRAVHTIFTSIEQQKKLGWDFTVKCSFIEIYNENIRDLLNPKSQAAHEIKMADGNPDDVVVTNLTVKKVEKEEDLLSLLAKAQKSRFTAATVMNEYSSRSHSIAQIKLEGHHASRKSTCQGMLNLIDLAGSEKYRSENTTDRKVETCKINQSLSTLGLVVMKLSEQSEHIPFRDSKLTHLLMPSLKGNSKTLMLVNLAPLEECLQESISSLRFAHRVSTVKVNAKRQVKSSVSSSKA